MADAKIAQQWMSDAIVQLGWARRRARLMSPAGDIEWSVKFEVSRYGSRVGFSAGAKLEQEGVKDVPRQFPLVIYSGAKPFSFDDATWVALDLESELQDCEREAALKRIAVRSASYLGHISTWETLRRAYSQGELAGAAVRADLRAAFHATEL